MVVSTKIHRKIPTFLLAGVLFMERICMAKCAFAFLPLSLHRSNTSLSSKISRTTPTTPTTGLLGSKHEDPFHVAIHPARRKNALNYLDDDILDRRTTLSHITSLATTLAILPPALATEQELASPSPSSTITSSSISSNQSILETRLRENSTTPPTYGMEDTDIRYPPYFLGTFTAISKTTDVYAPCGYELFSGGKAAYDATVEREVVKGESLSYRARFVASGGNVGGAGIGVGVRGVEGAVPSSSSSSSSTNDNSSNYGSYIAADREFNAKEIAKAAMGSYSVVDVSVATPNRFSCLLAPPSGTGDLISVDILTIARKAETISPTKFACSEVVRQIVSPASSRAGASTPKLVKEIETISIYDVGSGIDDNNIATGVDLGSIRQIPCRQRTATYLVPSQTDPVALKMWQMSRGRPVDVRFYDVVYTRV